MILASLGVIIGILLLVWSADKFVDGAASIATYYGMPSLLVGMTIVGFGTSAPEILVSILSALDNSAGLALGNAYGSNIANIALILGVTALIAPMLVKQEILKKEFVQLALVTVLSIALIIDKDLSRLDSIILLVVFIGIMWHTISKAYKNRNNKIIKSNDNSADEELDIKNIKPGLAFFWLIIGFALLVISSKILVWGAVEIAHFFNVSDTIIGLTIVAIGTSLPELASSVVAARKGEQDLAIGNVIGSNFFNTLVVVGIAGVIQPFAISNEILYRDVTIMSLLTISLFVFAYGYGKPMGTIGRKAGLFWIMVYVSYTGYLIYQITSSAN